MFLMNTCEVLQDTIDEAQPEQGNVLSQDSKVKLVVGSSDVTRKDRDQLIHSWGECFTTDPEILWVTVKLKKCDLSLDSDIFITVKY